MTAGFGSTGGWKNLLKSSRLPSVGFPIWTTTCEDLREAQKGSVAGSAASAGLEDAHWLCPIEDRRRIDSSREGMIEGFSLGSYLLLVDYTGRFFREGKAMISREVARIFERLGTTAETWQARMQKLSGGRLLGRFLAASRERLRDVTRRLRLRRAVNLGMVPLRVTPAAH
jgi:hypothetical protein